MNWEMQHSHTSPFSCCQQGLPVWCVKIGFFKKRSQKFRFLCKNIVVGTTKKRRDRPVNSSPYQHFQFPCCILWLRRAALPVFGSIRCRVKAIGRCLRAGIMPRLLLFSPSVARCLIHLYSVLVHAF